MEAVAWKYLRKALDGLAKTQRLTDRIEKGIPDVLVCDLRFIIDPSDAGPSRRTGLLELKHVASVDERLDIRADQALYLANWAVAGFAGLLIRVGSSPDDFWVYLHPQRQASWLKAIRSVHWYTLKRDCRDMWDKRNNAGDLGTWVLDNLFLLQ